MLWGAGFSLKPELSAMYIWRAAWGIPNRYLRQNICAVMPIIWESFFQNALRFCEPCNTNNVEVKSRNAKGFGVFSAHLHEICASERETIDKTQKEWEYYTNVELWINLFGLNNKLGMWPRNGIAFGMVGGRLLVCEFCLLISISQDNREIT